MVIMVIYEKYGYLLKHGYFQKAWLFMKSMVGSSSVNVQTQPTAPTAISNKPAIPANNYNMMARNTISSCMA